MTTGVGTTLTMGYDGLRRLTSVTGGPVTRQYTYRDIDSTKTTMQVASVTSGWLQYGYTYDSMGNIATYAAPGKGTVTYTYDNRASCSVLRVTPPTPIPTMVQETSSLLPTAQRPTNEPEHSCEWHHSRTSS